MIHLSKSHHVIGNSSKLIKLVLGPLFFLLYINDLPKASRLTEFLHFADDTSISFSHSNPNYLENVLNNE